MFLRFLLAAVLTASAFAQPTPTPSATSVFQQVNEMTSALSEITGWNIKKKVPAQMLGKDTFRNYVEKRMKETESSKEARAEEITLKMFGFIPQDFDLAKGTVDLVSEQAAAFYDYNKKRLFILDSTSEGNEQRVALVHELAHALADQHHPLGKFLRKGNPDDDETTARQSVMEGQATWLTWAYMAKRGGGKAEIPPTMIEQLTKETASDSNDFPVFAKAPLYLRETLVFPYNEGLRFCDAVYHKLGRAGFDAVFEHAPLSTQQILHPDLYFSNEKPLEPDVQTAKQTFGTDEKQYRVIAEGSVGELDFSILLRQFVGQKEGAAAARHWRGGSFRLYENKKDKKPVLDFVAEWDSPEAAHQFFVLYQRVMKGKWKQFRPVTSQQSGAASTLLSGSGDFGRFLLSASGNKVESVEGLRDKM